MKIIAIDYDGVIVDSIMDSLFVSHNAYLRLYGAEHKQYFGGTLFTFQNWPEKKKKYAQRIQEYRLLRPYIRMASDYGLIQKLMEEGRKIPNQQAFDHYREVTDFDFKRYHDAFYQERMRLQQEDFQSWLKLVPPYYGIVTGIRRFITEGYKVMIATSNRREIVARNFQPQYYNIPIRPKDILDHRFGSDKSMQMTYIHEQFATPYQDICFIDDQLAHLKQTRKLGIKPFLAGWSYATEQQKKEAKTLGMPVIRTEQVFYQMVRNYLKETN